MGDSVTISSRTGGYQNLSRFRGELMGLAMLWVMLFHAYPFRFQVRILDEIKSAGFAGVDVFILLSAMGLYVSIRTTGRPLRDFYGRRAARILPAFWLVVGAYSLWLRLQGRISLTVAAIAWQFILSPSLGLVPYWLDQLFGIEGLNLLGTRETAMATIVFITVWKNFGYFMVIFLAGLQGISAELYEAASLDGASAWQKFPYITLPALRPTFNYVVIFGLIGSFQVFDQVFILTSGGPARATETIVYRIYTEAFGNGKLGYASALSYVLLIMTLIVGLIQLYTNAKHEREEIA